MRLSTSLKRDAASRILFYMAENLSPERDHSVTLVKPDRLTLAGLVLYGPRWKAPLARTLGVSRETVSRWIGSGDIPKWAINTATLLSAAKGAVLSLCDRTGNMVQPWADAGFECFTVDTSHQPG